MIGAALFDLDGTLLDRDASMPLVLAAQHARRPALAAVPADLYVARFLELDEHGHGGTLNAYRRLLTECGVDSVSAQELELDYAARFRQHCVPFPGVRVTLERLAAAGLRLGIVTNGPGEMQLGSIRALGIERFFDAIVISGVEGVRKPDAEIFRRALHRLGTAPHEAIFVGDHPIVDIAGARAAGMRAVWKRTPYWNAPAGVGAIDSIYELPDALDAMQ
jgi:HAD superfamily hydrolase (TIGR01549 family)